MRKAIILGVVGLFVASGAAFAEGTSVGKGGCGWGSTKSASSGTPAQTVATASSFFIANVSAAFIVHHLLCG